MPNPRGEKLRPIASRLSALLEDHFGEPAPFDLEVDLTWMPSVPNPKTHRTHWSALKEVYAALVDGVFDLDERMAKYADQLRYGAMRVDAFFSAPYSFAFAIRRAVTLQPLPRFNLRTLSLLSRLFVRLRLLSRVLFSHSRYAEYHHLPSTKKFRPALSAPARRLST